MEINGIKYEPLLGNIIPVYRFIEGQKTEEFWMDAQNCCYYTYCDGKYDDETRLYDGKNWWLLWPYIPEGTKTEDVTKEIAKWIVDDSSIEVDVDKEWDFKKHQVKKKIV